MRLKQKFFNVYTSYYKKSNELDKMVEVADDYAIEFAEWLMKIRFKSIEKLTAKELLEIFKQEKGYGGV